MDELFEKIKDIVIEYGVEASPLSIRLAIETYRDLRHYPKDWGKDKIESDMLNNISKIAMASVEIDSKEGVEGQTSHSEGGVSRSYKEYLLAYQGVCGYGNSF